MSGKLDLINTNRSRLACVQGSRYAVKFYFKKNGKAIDISNFSSAKMQVRSGDGGVTFSRGLWNPRTASVDAWFSAQGLVGSNGSELVGKTWIDLSDQKQDFSTDDVSPTIVFGELDYPFIHSYENGSILTAPFKINGPFTLAFLRRFNIVDAGGLTIKSDLGGDNFSCILGDDQKTITVKLEVK